jgi:FkbM family methyltransferase
MLISGVAHEAPQMIQSQLEFLDAEIVAKRQAEVAQIVTAAAERGGLCLVGSAALPAKCARGLAAMGAKPRFLIEFDARYWGRTVEGVPVVGPREAFSELGDNAVVIVAIWSPQHAFATTLDWLGFFGFRNVFPVQAAFWTAAAQIGEHYQFGEPAPLLVAAPLARTLASRLADEESRRQFADHLRWRTSLDSRALPPGDRRRAYFGVSFLTIPEDAAIVDVGAFDGDSLRNFLLWRGTFRSYSALEPDPISYHLLREYIASLPQAIARRIRPVQVAAAAAPGTLMVSPTGKPGSATGGCGSQAQPVPSVRISDYFADQQISYLKFDIEGAEREALTGAWDLIERDRPTLAVAVYHKPLDIVEIPLEIIRRTPGYRYYIRSHDDDGIDLTFYAAPPV